MTLGRERVLILGFLLLGLCQSESPVEPRPVNPSECKNIVNCFVDPCQVNECPEHPEATCIANYCGGCHAIFLDASGNQIKECSDQKGERCKGGQVLNECGSSCTKIKTCSEPNPKSEDVCTEECVSKCECPASQPIWRNERCITEEECITDPIQECKSNLVWNECGSSCERPWRTCSDKENNKAFSIAEAGREEGQTCAAVCRPRCECPEDAPVLHNFICIPETSCPKEPEKCTDWVFMCPINPCEQHTCSSNPGAGCRPYYCGGCFANFFNEVDAPVEACSATQATCSGGQVWNDCGMACLRTCNDPDPMCTQNCVPRCQCPAEKPIWKEGECVTVSECDSSQCKSNMVFEECGGCIPTCRVPNPICTEECVAGCRCPKDLPILHQGVCTTKEMCPEIPEPECEGGKVFEDQCASKCTSSCVNPEPVCTFECARRCTCPLDAPILHNGACIPANECPDILPECKGGQVWKTCGMSCTLTCDDPRPTCTKECVERCQCPRSKPIWHEDEGHCIPLDRCPDKPAPKEKCTHDGKVYSEGEEWKPDPCTTCMCEIDPQTQKKTEICYSIDCAYPECETEVIMPKDQCCPICADPCSHGGDTVYDVGEEWTPDPCTTCHCVETGDGERKQMCAKIYCDIPRCDTELVWDEKSCCPYCAEECTHNGRVYEVGDSWKPNDCTSCQCYEEDGEKKQSCAMPRCMPPGPHCRHYHVPGECCPRCRDTCTMYDHTTGTKKTYEVGETWKPDSCTHCTCENNSATGEVQESCLAYDCDWDLDCGPYEKPVHEEGMCCPICLKPCYEIDKEGELILHEEGEEWQKTPCITCRCVPDEETVYKNVCFEIMCDIPICEEFSEIIYDPESCCPYCSDPCSFKGVSYDVGDSWKTEPCTSCTCTEEEGKRMHICAAESCAAPEEGCDLVYSIDSCCPKCQQQCEMYDGGKTIEYQPGDEWKPDACTYCYCGLNDQGEKEHHCAMADCAPLEDTCVPVYNVEECCPVCEETEKLCELQPHMDYGHAIDKSGTGKDTIYTFECDDGYWIKKESGNTAFCNKIGEAVYPVCEKLSISTRLVEQARAPGTYMLEISSPDASGAAGRWGLLCDDGWSDREAQLICKKHGYNFGRAVSLESDREDFLFTQMSCPRDDDFLLQHCSITRYSEAKLSCQFNEVAGLFCYNAAFEYRIKDKIKSKWSRRTIALYFDVSALKYGKPLNLKRGIFELEPSDFTVTSNKSTSKATKARIKFRDGVATVRMKLKKPRNFQTSDCISLTIKGPSPEYDYHEKEICSD